MCSITRACYVVTWALLQIYRARLRAGKMPASVAAERGPNESSPLLRYRSQELSCALPHISHSMTSKLKTCRSSYGCQEWQRNDGESVPARLGVAWASTRGCFARPRAAPAARCEL